jgi:hypothetical protein
MILSPLADRKILRLCWHGRRDGSLGFESSEHLSVQVDFPIMLQGIERGSRSIVNVQQQRNGQNDGALPTKCIQFTLESSLRRGFEPFDHSIALFRQQMVWRPWRCTLHSIFLGQSRSSAESHPDMTTAGSDRWRSKCLHP